jgi:hypothetical protein
MSKVGFVSVHYYSRYLPRAVRAAIDLARHIGAQRFVAVANRPDLVPALRTAVEHGATWPTEVVLHDNRGLEFGAYEAGLRRIADREFDWVVFTNDSFSVHNCFSSVYRARLAAAVARTTDGSTPEVAGEVVSLGRSYRIEGLRTHRWLTTNVFGLNRPALNALQHRLYFPEIDQLVRTSAKVDEFFSPRLDPALRAHIEAWLLRPAEAGTWYGAQTLDAGNAERLAAKARAILQEKYLSALLEEASAWFFDTNPSGFRERVVKRAERAWFELRRRWEPKRVSD